MGLRSFAAELLLPAVLNPRARDKSTAPAAPRPETTTFAALAERIGYLSKADQKLVREAFRFADEAHLGQHRASGEPYITHPLAVAGIVADWRLDVQALAAALLHDAMEDCGITKPQLIEHFGAATADLVDGLTKLDKLQFATREQGQAESFRKMLLAMARDIRVIMIKLADRLHNMRTMGPMVPHKRMRIARETLDIYAPIAHRLGLNGVYRELQERSFESMHPWRHAVLAAALERVRGHRRDIVGRVESDVKRAFARAKMKVQMHGREKTVYSIYRKMRDKHAGFAAVNDLFGFRIVAPSLMDCYTALGILHQLYKPVPGRFKDYIALPKPNGYQSLHTSVLSPLGTAVEFQIRTETMHAVAESGIAAHWIYKQKGALDDGEAQKLGAMWMQSLVDIQGDTQHDAGEFIEHVKIDLAPESVYVFTPKGKILGLPRGATVLDFAYAIHSDVGDRTADAKVNGEPVPLRTVLSSGDVVSIETREDAHPHPSWLAFVRTGRARAKIRHHLRTRAQHESRALGLRLLQQAVRAEGLQLPPPPSPAPSPASSVEAAPLTVEPQDATAHAVWSQLLRAHGSKSADELLVDLGVGRKIATIVGKHTAKLLIEQGQQPDAVALTLGRFGADAASAAPLAGVWIDGSEGASVRLAPCCMPIPGDAVRGYLGRGDALEVHTRDCAVGRRLHERDPERWMDVEWSDQPTRTFDTQVRMMVHNHKGALAKIAQAVSAAEGDISHIRMDQDEAGDAVELTLRVAVRDRQHLADVLRALKRSAPVAKAQRLRG